MEIRIQYQGVDGSPWMEEYMEGKLARLERYLSSGAEIEINLISQGDRCYTHFKVKSLHHEHHLEKEGCDIFEAFTLALEEAAMVLRREHLKVHQKFNKEFIDFIEP